MTSSHRFIFWIVLLMVILIYPQTTIYSESTDEIRYVAIGDSYTIGEGVSIEESWSSLLVAHLRSSGINIKLITNPARTGFTTRDAINYELGIYKSLKPTFATLLIGVNDWVHGVSEETFRRHLKILLDQMLSVLPQKDRLLVVTIPDFSAAPNGIRYGSGRNISAGITEFNSIIREEVKQRGLSVINIFPISQEMNRDSALVSNDGLHPSAKEYALWEALIYPEAYKILSSRRLNEELQHEKTSR